MSDGDKAFLWFICFALFVGFIVWVDSGPDYPEIAKQNCRKVGGDPVEFYDPSVKMGAGPSIRCPGHPEISP